MTKEEKILQFLVQNKGKFNNSQIESLRNKLNNADEADIDKCSYIPLKNHWATFILNFFLGSLGAGYFYLRNYSLAILVIVFSLVWPVLVTIFYPLVVLWILGLLSIWLGSFNETHTWNYSEICAILDKKA